MSEKIFVVGFGSTSTPFAREVKKYLESDFNFSVNMIDDYPEKRGSFINGETRFQRPLDELTSGILKDQIVYVVQDLIINDTRLVDISEAIQDISKKIGKKSLLLETRIKEMGNTIEDIKKENPSHLVNKLGQEYISINEIISELKGDYLTQEQNLSRLEKLTKPDFSKMLGCPSGSVEHHPDRILKKLKTTLKYIHENKPLYSAFAGRNISYERSHNHQKIRIKYNIWEMRGLKDVIEGIRAYGTNSIILIHPHAPKEGLKYSKELEMHYTSINHQGLTLVDGEVIDLHKNFNSNYELLFPFENRLKVKSSFDESYKPHRCLFLSPDQGALDNVDEFARINGYKSQKSLKERKGEGDTNITQKPDISLFLDSLKQQSIGGPVKFIILDDMVNTGGTTNTLAIEMREEVEKYNRQYNTEFTPSIEVWATHFITPYIKKMLKHHAIDKFVVLDTIPHEPSLPSKLKELDLQGKVEIINCAAYQVAAGIKLDYDMHAKHLKKVV